MKNVVVTVDKNAINHKLSSIVDEELMYRVHQKFAETIEPWVPMKSGALSSGVEIHPYRIRYPGPYAHYQYTGITYGPNIPIIKNGVIVGWYSIPGMKKHPTGGRLEYSTEKHPLATANWDKVAMQSEMDSFTAAVKEELVRRAKELYG